MIFWKRKIIAFFNTLTLPLQNKKKFILPGHLFCFLVVWGMQSDGIHEDVRSIYWEFLVKHSFV